MNTKAAAHLNDDVAEEAAKRRTIKLSRVISDGTNTWNEITLAEPTLAHHIASERAEGMAQVIALYSTLSGVPEEAIRRMKTVDSRKIQAVLEETLDDAPAPRPAEVDGAVFDLLHPISAGGRPIKSVTLREPDLEAGIALEKVKGGPNQITAASIAILSGLTIPVVSKLSKKDVKRMEAWLLPFLSDTDQTADGEI
jgi:hypothetical protein